MTKLNPENCKNCSSKWQLQYTIQHRTVLIISPLTSRQTSQLRCCLSEERVHYVKQPPTERTCSILCTYQLNDKRYRWWWMKGKVPPELCHLILALVHEQRNMMRSKPQTPHIYVTSLTLLSQLAIVENKQWNFSFKKYTHCWRRQTDYPLSMHKENGSTRRDWHPTQIHY